MDKAQLRQKLARAASPKPVKIKVDAWDAEVYVLPLSGADREDHKALTEKMEEGDLSADAIYQGTVMDRLVDEDGERIFDETDEDIEAFLALDWRGVEEVYGALMSSVLMRRAMVEGVKGNLKSARGK